MRCPSVGKLIGLTSLQPLSFSWGCLVEGDALGLFQSRLDLGPHLLNNLQSMPPMSLQHVDHSEMATKMQAFLQGSRFHRSFLFFNNLSAAIGAFYTQTQYALSDLKTGFKHDKPKQFEAAQSLAQFFEHEREALHGFLNATDTRLGDFQTKLGQEDTAWVQSLADPVIQHMKQVMAAMDGKVQLMQGVSNVSTICSMADAVLSDLRTLDVMIREHAQPAVNKTTELLPRMVSNSSKGRLKMLRRFGDQGYSILEKMRSIVVMPLGTLPDLLSEHVQCGGAGKPEERQGGNISDVAGQHVKEAPLVAPPQEAPKPAALQPEPRQVPAELNELVRAVATSESKSEAKSESGLTAAVAPSAADQDHSFAAGLAPGLLGIWVLAAMPRL